MARIRRLDTIVVNQIAAGEVIERPASVVKELVENSLDAGAKRIDIDIEVGGTELIRIVDDGHGIHPDDLHLAFASHATSKLRESDDLLRIGTLGFRGEAVASIGSVSRMTVQSRALGEPSGREMSCIGGVLQQAKPWNGSVGTRIEVRHLFYNIPARKKFMKAIPTEVGHITEAVVRLALAHPGTHWTLKHNGRLIHEVTSSMDLLGRVYLFFDKELRGKLFEFDATSDDARLFGLIGDPSADRGTTRYQYLFVNGRWIRDRSLGHAVAEAYRGLIMVGRHPVTFLFLQLPPEQIDVNVHPTKSEVRFRDSSSLYHLIRGTIKKRLLQENLVPRLEVAAPSEQTFSPRRSDAESSSAPWEVREIPPVPLTPVRSPEPAPWERPAPEKPPEPTPAPAGAPASLMLPAVGTTKAIQIHDSYLVVETQEGMLVIDQHALHERILFEQLQHRVRSGKLEVQRLLIPEPVDLPLEQAGLVLDSREALASIGLEVESFGGGTVLLSSYPTLLGRRNPSDIFQGVLDYLLSKERPPSRERLLNDLLATMACKAAVKAGDPLTAQEIDALMELRKLADDSHHCPHGRPTSLLFSRGELEKQFRRV